MFVLYYIVLEYARAEEERVERWWVGSRLHVLLMGKRRSRRRGSEKMVDGKLFTCSVGEKERERSEGEVGTGSSLTDHRITYAI